MNRKILLGAFVCVALLIIGCESNTRQGYTQEQINKNSERSQLIDDVLSCINTPDDPLCVDRAITQNDPAEKMREQEDSAVQDEDIGACNDIADEKIVESCKMNIFINTNKKGITNSSSKSNS